MNERNLEEINYERLQRYLRPPYLRHYCYSGYADGCTWAEIDIDNYAIPAQWLDYSLVCATAVLFGLLTFLLAWFHTEAPKPEPE